MATYFTLLYSFIIINIHFIKCYSQVGHDGGGGDTQPATNVDHSGHDQSSLSPHQVCQPNVYVAPVINCSTSDILKEVSQLRQEVTLLNERVHRLTEHIGSALPGVIPRSCDEIQQLNSKSHSGVYTIQPDHGSWPFQVYCDMETDGGGWMVFQRRLNGSVNFYRSWASYRRGFGDKEGEFWLGNDKIHQITALDEYELRIDMQDFDNISQFANYGKFYVENFENNYRLHVDQYSGVAGDSLAFSNNQAFTTKDRDNDVYGSNNCAELMQGAWWYKDCLRAHLNGLYLGGRTEIAWKGVIWNTWKGQFYSLKNVEMKIRPVRSD